MRVASDLQFIKLCKHTPRMFYLCVQTQCACWGSRVESNLQAPSFNFSILGPTDNPFVVKWMHWANSSCCSRTFKQVPRLVSHSLMVWPIWWFPNNQPVPVLEPGNALLEPIQSTNKFIGTLAPDFDGSFTRGRYGVLSSKSAILTAAQWATRSRVKSVWQSHVPHSVGAVLGTGHHQSIAEASVQSSLMVHQHVQNFIHVTIPDPHCRVWRASHNDTWHPGDIGQSPCAPLTLSNIPSWFYPRS